MKQGTVCWRAIFVVITCAVMFGCSKKSTAPRVVVLSAQVNSRGWQAYSAHVAVSQSPSLHVVIDADSANSHIKLDLGKYTGAGTYSLVDSTNAAYYTNYAAAGGYLSHRATSGHIIITSNQLAPNGQTEIKGTFQFLGDTVAVVNGVFDVSFNLN